MGRKYLAKADRNQPEIVAEYRRLGATVKPVHMVGSGFVDIVIGFMGVSDLVEIKDPEKPLSSRKLTPLELEWHKDWQGSARVIETKDDVKAHLDEILQAIE